MKVTHLIAAGLVMAGLGVSTAASAQDWHQRHGWHNHRHCHMEYHHHHRMQVCR